MKEDKSEEVLKFEDSVKAWLTEKCQLQLQ
jgi:hypothetical protein